MMLPPFEREVARMMRLLMITLEHDCPDKSDIREIAGRLKRMPGEDDGFTRLAHITASRALRWAYFNGPGDEQNLFNAAYALLKELNQKALASRPKN